MRKSRKIKRKRKKTLKSKKIGGSYDDRITIYTENMKHIELLQDSSICEVVSINLKSTGKESMGVYVINHNKLKNIIYKKIQTPQNYEMKHSIHLSKIVTDGIFPNFPIYYGHKFCKEYNMLFYEMATGDGAKWAADQYDSVNIKNQFISFLIQSAMIGFRLDYEKLWIDDFKPENYLYIDMMESSNKYFHYRYRYNDDSYIDIFVLCTGELWLRSDFGYVMNGTNSSGRAVQETWSMYDKFKEMQQQTSILPFYRKLLENQKSGATPLSPFMQPVTNEMIRRIEMNETNAKHKQLGYNAINKIRANRWVDKIYKALIQSFTDITVLNKRDIFDESLLTERPSDELILNKTPYRLNY